MTGERNEQRKQGDVTMTTTSDTCTCGDGDCQTCYPENKLRTKVYSVEFWVKRYDDFNRMFETRVDSRRNAYRLYQRWMSDGNHYFVQMGAASELGSIVLNEWQKPTKG
jgi:hypothetical protein